MRLRRRSYTTPRGTIHRHDCLPDELFGEYAWSALLHLFVADAASQRLTGHMLCELTVCPAPVMQRWLIYLSKQQLVVGDGDGDLGDLLTLSATGLAAIEAYLAHTTELAERIFGWPVK